MSDLYSAANMSVCVDANITGTFSQIFLKFIINYFNVYYKISTPVVFCPYTGFHTYVGADDMWVSCRGGICVQTYNVIAIFGVITNYLQAYCL